MKKLFTVICIIVTISSLCSTVLASAESYSWYCAHCRDHVPPKADTSFDFIDDYDAFYIDKEHSDANTDKVIYLTFDAGYNNGNIDKILDTLKEENVSAAFFVLGHLIESDTALIERMFNEGHLVCNHTFSHKKMIQLSESEFCAELEKLEEKCIQATGKELAKFYRPPQGVFDKDSLNYAKNLGYKTVFWSFAYDDWDNNRQMSFEKAEKKVIENLHNGEIMLLHPTSSTNAAILGKIIKEAKQQGYRFGSLDEIK